MVGEKANGEDETRVEQREAALARANNVRAQRARLWKALRSRPRIAVTVLHSPPPWMRSCRIALMLKHLPGIGKKKVGNLMDDAGLSRDATFEAAPASCRYELAERLEERYWERAR